MKNFFLRIALVAFLVALQVSFAASPMFAAIRPEAVSPIWDNLTRTAGLKDAGPVNIENKKEPNAWVSFSANKYSVHATTGLLETLKDEQELAGVLAHEIGHIKMGHYNESINRSLMWLLLYKALGEKKVGGVDVLGAGIVLAEAGFSREQEVEADDYGVHLAAKAGYDPWGLYNAFNSMKRAGYKTSPSGFNSHPPTERRMTHVKATTEAVQKQIR